MTVQYWTIICICIAGILIGRKYDKSIINPVLVFNVLWILVLMFLKIGIAWGYDEPTDEMMRVICTGCLAFNTVGLLMTVFLKKGVRFIFSNQQSGDVSFEPRTKLITSLIIIVLLYSMFFYREVLSQLANGVISLADVRINYFHSMNDFVERYIISPIRYAIIVNVILNVLYKKVNKLHLLLTIVIALLSAFSSGGRLILINMVLMVFAAVGLYAIDHTFTRRQKGLIIFGLACILVFVVVITSFRTNTLLALGYTSLWDRIVQTFVSYFSGGPIYMGKLLDIYPIKGSTYGLSFIWGFLDIFFYFFAALGVFPYPQNVSLGKYTVQVINIGNNTFFNAFFTSFSYFYADFGYAGVFIETAIFAFLIINVFSRAVKTYKKSILNSAYYIMLFAIICNFSTRWLIYDSAFALSFIVIRLCYRKVRPTHEIT